MADEIEGGTLPTVEAVRSLLEERGYAAHARAVDAYAAARAEADTLRDLIRDIRIACLGAQFPSDGDHEKAWEAFDKAGIDA